jgi:hypothetical protein
VATVAIGEKIVIQQTQEMLELVMLQVVVEVVLLDQMFLVAEQVLQVVLA